MIEPGASWDDGGLAAIATAGLPDGDDDAWIALPPTGAVRLLVPRAAAGASIPALRSLLGHGSPLRRFGAEVGAQALRLGGGHLLPRRPKWDMAANRLVARARDVADMPDAVGVIRLNPDRPNRKPVVQLLAPDLAVTRAYVKIGWDALSAPLVRREATTLAELVPPPGLELPSVLGATDDVPPTLAVAPLDTAGDVERGVSTTELARTALRLFGPEGFGVEEPVPLVETPLVAAIDGDLAAWDDEALREPLRERRDRLLRRAGQVAFATSRWHGDFNPANVVWSGGAVAAWDWERSATGAPTGLDAAYALLTDHSPHDAVLALEHLGVERRQAQPLVVLALLVVAVRHAAAAAHGLATRTDAAMARLDAALDSALGAP